MQNQLEPISPELSLVMPVYNESDIIESVLREWVAFLTEAKIHFEVVVVNDGSLDGTVRILDRMRREMPVLRVVHQLNNGHGKAVRRGYESARGKYILQVDSNGRFEPADFLPLWERRLETHLVLGMRSFRSESTLYRTMSALLTKISRFLFGVRLQDPNVPFRLFRRAVILPYVSLLPSTHETVNLGLALLLGRDYPGMIAEVAVPWRPRRFGRKMPGFAATLGLWLGIFREVLSLRCLGVGSNRPSTHLTLQAAE